MLRFAVLPIAAAAACAASAAAAPPPPSADWRVVVTDEEPDVGRILGFADAGTLERRGSEVGFWLEYRLQNAAEGADGYRGRVTAHCSTFAYRSEALARLAGATVIESGASESGLTAAPGTNIRIAIEAACAGKWLTGRVDPVAHARAAFGK